jgi:DNA-binding transcriptional ArsR family regulator
MPDDASRRVSQMNVEPDLATIAALIGDPTRAAILSALMDGQALPASDLAYRAQITPQTTSAHLAKLVEGGLLSMTTSGRHRYYRLKNADVARALEALAVISPLPNARSPRQTAALRDIHFARTCYDHLAGRLGVAITQALQDKGYLVLVEEDFDVTPQGREWLAAWNIDEQQLRRGRRVFACACLDWSERRYHVAGALGAAIASKLFEAKWAVRVPGNRAVRLTTDGRKRLKHDLGLDLTLDGGLMNAS